MSDDAKLAPPIDYPQMTAKDAQDLDVLRHGCIIEIAVRNESGSVSDYMNHWEGRALKAEAELAAGGSLVPARLRDLAWYMAHLNHHDGINGSHRSADGIWARFEECPHPDCVLVRAGVSPRVEPEP